MTLEEDFGIWWNMKKYSTADIPAREFGSCKIKQRHGSNRGWPGVEKDVEYWVELEGGTAVGFRHLKRPSGRWEKHAEFPVVTKG